jgi:hypothetical protein
MAPPCLRVVVAAVTGSGTYQSSGSGLKEHVVVAAPTGNPPTHTHMVKSIITKGKRLVQLHTASWLCQNQRRIHERCCVVSQKCVPAGEGG